MRRDLDSDVFSRYESLGTGNRDIIGKNDDIGLDYVFRTKPVLNTHCTLYLNLGLEIMLPGKLFQYFRRHVGMCNPRCTRGNRNQSHPPTLLDHIAEEIDDFFISLRSLE